MAYVTTWQGQKIDFDVALGQMDQKIKERLAKNFSPCTDQEFIDIYQIAHLESFKTEKIWDVQ